MRFEKQPLNYLHWFGSLLCWDGVLPLVVVTVPGTIMVIAPNRDDIAILVAVAFPILALLTRLAIAKRHIASNHCGRVLRKLQFIALAIAIMALFQFDALFMLPIVVPNQAHVRLSVLEVLIFVVLASIYLPAMTFALYPGRTWTRERDSALQPNNRNP